MDDQVDKCAKCGETRKEHTYNGACYGKCGEYVHHEPVIEHRYIRVLEPSSYGPYLEGDNVKLTFEDSRLIKVELI